MNNRNDGKLYEEMVFLVYKNLCKDERLTSVQCNVKIPGIDGVRQIDVLVKHEHAGISYTTIIECRDYAGKLNVTHIDAFASKLMDVQASKGVIVSRKGFSKTAIQKANRVGIGLCIVDNAETILKRIVIEVPVILKIVHPSLYIETLMYNSNNVEIKMPHGSWTTINDVPLRHLALQELRDGVINIPDEKKILDWKPKDLLSPFFVRDATGKKVDVIRFKVSLHLNIWYLFGHTNSLPDFIVKTNIGETIHNVFIPDRFKMDLNASFVRYDRRSEIPYSQNEAINGVYIPEAESPATSNHEAWSFGGHR